jgi:hypothetical protein
MPCVLAANDGPKQNFSAEDGRTPYESTNRSHTLLTDLFRLWGANPPEWHVVEISSSRVTHKHARPSRPLGYRPPRH